MILMNIVEDTSKAEAAGQQYPKLKENIEEEMKRPQLELEKKKEEIKKQKEAMHLQLKQVQKEKEAEQLIKEMPYYC